MSDDDSDADSLATLSLPEPADPRWICAHCGALALLDDDGLCRYCWPERALTFVEVCCMAAHGDGGDFEAKWRIG